MKVIEEDVQQLKGALKELLGKDGVTNWRTATIARRTSAGALQPLALPHMHNLNQEQGTREPTATNRNSPDSATLQLPLCCDWMRTQTTRCSVALLCIMLQEPQPPLAVACCVRYPRAC